MGVENLYLYSFAPRTARADNRESESAPRQREGGHIGFLPACPVPRGEGNVFAVFVQAEGEDIGEFQPC